MSQQRTMYMPSSTPTAFSAVPKLKKEGFDVPSPRAGARQDGQGPGQRGPADGDAQQQQQRPSSALAFDSVGSKLDGSDLGLHRQLQNEHAGWGLDASTLPRPTGSPANYNGGMPKYTLPYPSATSFPTASFAAASAAEIDDALSSLVGSFPTGRLSYDHPVNHAHSGAHAAFSYPQTMADLAPAYSLNPLSLSIPQAGALHTADVHLGGRTSAVGSPDPSGHAPPASFSPRSSRTTHSLFDSYKAVPSSSADYAAAAHGGGNFASLSYTDSLASPATSVSLSSCHPGGPTGSGAAANGGSSLRSRSRSSIRDHREAAASAPAAATLGLGGRTRVARRGSFNSEADRLLSPPTANGSSSTLPTTATDSSGGSSSNGNGGHQRRASSIIIPSSSAHSAGLGLAFQTGSLPAYSSGGQGQSASWGVFSPTSEKGELPLVREDDTGDDELEEMNRVDDDSKHDTLAEKRRRRRESHNAVERRRRDTINEKISELSTLLPACLLDPTRTAPIPAAELAAPLCALNVDLTFASALPSSAAADDDDDDEHGPLVSVEDEAKGGKGGGKGKGKKAGKRKTGGGGGLNAIGPDGKPNKGIVLKKSVQYIQYLHLIIKTQAARTADLEHMLQMAIQGQSPPSSVSQPSVSASDASASPSNGYAPSHMSHASAPPRTASAPAAKSEAAAASFPSLHEMLADADNSSYAMYGGGDVSMRSGAGDIGGVGSHAPSSSFLATGQASGTGSGISSPNLFPWSANLGSPSAQSRPDTANGMLADHSTPSTSSRRDSAADDDDELVEERGRGRGPRLLPTLAGEGWGQDAAGGNVSGGFRGFDERGHFGALFAGGGGDVLPHGRRDDVIME